jgi:glycosyltransferase involved in cell wall biosynthesis
VKVALVHDWLVTYGGAERVVEALLEVYPEADIYTLVYSKKKMAAHFPPEKVHTSFLQQLPFAVKLYTKMLSLMPRAFESFDFSGYDLVICSSSSCAKGVITPPDVPQIAYIHTPMRYAWDLFFTYRQKSGQITRFFMNAQIPSIRQWDYISSQRIDLIIANSHYIARRIRKYWNRESSVIYPPVDTARLLSSADERETYYVVFSRFVPYKRIDLAITACIRTGRRLIVIGDGPEKKKLLAIAAQGCTKENKELVTFTGRISDDAVQRWLNKARGLIFCAEEDFGIIPVEAQACGCPVIAYGKGGACETVIEEVTGVFFSEQTSDSVISALDRFEKLEKNGVFKKETLTQHAARFSKARFCAEFHAAADQIIATFRDKNHENCC